MKAQQPVVAKEHVDRRISGDTTAMLAQVSRELAEWVPILRWLIESQATQSLALGHGFEITSATVRSVIAARELRDKYFWPAMSENAWSVLLELFACRMEGTRLDVAGLCEATGLTPDIALHWADWLAGRGIVALKHLEGEICPVDLTDSGADSMRAYLLASLSLSPWVQ
jgi:hypothetical protein